jgi:hypothetical protein
MSNHPSTSSPALAEINQFIRPNGKAPTPVDTASTVDRLALKGAGFATSDEVAAAIREGVATELADAVMAALGNRFECLSDEDVCIARMSSPSKIMTHHTCLSRQVVTKLPDLPWRALLPCLRRKVPSPPRRMTCLRMSLLAVMAIPPWWSFLSMIPCPNGGGSVDAPRAN